MKAIITDNKRKILIDDDSIMDRWKWGTTPGGYAKRTTTRNGKKCSVLIHREIMNPPKDMVVDHINGDITDNRKKNLRVVTRSQNQENRHKKSVGKTSSVIGLSFYKGKWFIDKRVNGVRHRKSCTNKSDAITHLDSIVR